ncbi:MAG: radical SAM protein [Myxococcaceae bacterium]
MNIKNFSLAELTAAVVPLGASAFVARKVFAAVFAHHVQSLEEISRAPQVPRAVASWLRKEVQLPSLTVVDRRRAADGFVKYLFVSPSGGEFEAVRIPLFDSKYVVCISSQIGCALACAFCQTGKMGFRRNLATWEMVDQVMQIRAEADRPVRGVVFMGMGEPLLNYNASLGAAGILSHPAGLAISGKAISFSTAGHVPGIRRYLREDAPYRLVFSLTSAIPEKRAKVMPIEKTYPLPELVDAIRDYALQRRERAMLAYVAISGFNTGDEDAEALANLLEGIPVKIDLIDVTDPTGEFQPPSLEELGRFRSALQRLRAPIARRYSGGKEIQAACGTLAATRQGGISVSATTMSQQHLA